MAGRKSHHYLRSAEKLKPAAKPNDEFELDEADVWGTNGVIVSADVDRLPMAMGAKSLPVNIPEWSKILGGKHRGLAGEEEKDHDEENYKIPPHEQLARTRGASSSVHEGVGRTLKGRDLSRFRNAIWKQIGFED